MRKALVLVLLVGVVGLVLAGCASGAGKAECAGCKEMKTAGTGWCDACNKGMVNGKETACKNCVDAKGMCADCMNK